MTECLPTSAQNGSANRLIGVAAPQRQLQQSNPGGATMPVSSINAPLHLVARSAADNSNANNGQNAAILPWSTANIRSTRVPPTQKSLDNWQHQQNRVPLASPEVGLSGQASNNISGSSRPTNSSSTRFYIKPAFEGSSNYEGIYFIYYCVYSDLRIPLASGARIPLSSVTGALPQANSVTENDPSNNAAIIMRPQTYHVGANANQGLSGGRLLSVGGANDTGTNSDDASTVTNNSSSVATTIEDDIGGELDYSGTHGLLMGANNEPTMTSKSACNLSAPLEPIELVEQLSRILTVGDLSIPVRLLSFFAITILGLLIFLNSNLMEATVCLGNIEVVQLFAIAVVVSLSTMFQTVVNRLLVILRLVVFAQYLCLLFKWVPYRLSSEVKPCVESVCSDILKLFITTTYRVCDSPYQMLFQFWIFSLEHQKRRQMSMQQVEPLPQLWVLFETTMT